MKKNRSFTEEFFQICSSAIHDMIIDAKHSFISSAGCHHAECISSKISVTWKLQSVVSLPLENVSKPAVPNPRHTCGPVSISLSCMYNNDSLTLFL